MVTLRAGVRMMHRIAAAPPLSDYAGVDRHPVDLEDDAPLDALIGSRADRSEEHPSELPSLMRISYAVFCLKKKKVYARTPVSQQNTSEAHVCTPTTTKNSLILSF